MKIIYDIYAQQIVSKKKPACQLHRLTCQRYLNDRKKIKGFYFDEKRAAHAINFFSFLRHSKGRWAGQQFELALWQQFLTASIFGWRRDGDGTRRFRTAYIEIPRKNGKTTWLAGVGLYLFLADGEPGAEIYAAAVKRDQARLMHEEATRMVKKSTYLSQHVKIHRDNLHILSSFSKFEPLSADADTMDGLNVHGALIDELHAHKTREVWDVLATATGSRAQPLIVAITTAGYNQSGICYEQRLYAEQILKKTVIDNSYFAFIAGVDEGDNWQHKSTWRKANPNYGVTVEINDLKDKANKAKNIPAAQNTFLQKHLNIWTQQSTRWIDLELWDSANQVVGVIDESQLAGRVCYGGLDMSSVSDITAWVLIFPDEQDEDRLTVLCRFFCPSAVKMKSVRNKYRDQYVTWEKQGFIMATQGDALDYAFVKQKILDDAKRYDIKSVNIDRLFQAHQISSELTEEGINMCGMGQGFLSMALPVKEFQRLLLKKKINHGGNPVLRWMADNVSVKGDPAGNLKLDKAESQGKIDGISALVMAIDRRMKAKHDEAQKRLSVYSVYNDRDVRVL